MFLHQSQPPGPFRAVLFDVDGTLIDTAELIADCLDRTCREHLKRTFPREAYYSLIGRPAMAHMEVLVGEPANGENADFLARMMVTAIDHYEEHASEEQPFPAALDTLSRLSEVGIRLGLVTSKTRFELNPTLERVPLQRYAQVIITADMTTRPKPFPDPVYLALQTLQIPAEQVLFVGDAPYDLQSGRAAGVRTGAATWGPHPRAVLEGERPDYLFESFSQILALCEAR